MSADDCSAILHDGRPPPATTTVANDGVKWRVCDTHAPLWNDAPTKAVFRSLTTKAEPRPADMPDATAVAKS